MRALERTCTYACMDERRVPVMDLTNHALDRMRARGCLWLSLPAARTWFNLLVTRSTFWLINKSIVVFLLRLSAWHCGLLAGVRAVIPSSAYKDNNGKTSMVRMGFHFSSGHTLIRSPCGFLTLHFAAPCNRTRRPPATGTFTLVLVCAAAVNSLSLGHTC